MQKRPNLKLEIRGQADRNTDLQALKAQRLNEALNTLPESDALQARKMLADQWELDQRYLELARQYESELGSDAHLQAIDTLLKSTLNVDDLGFLQLAKQRAQVVLQNLREQHDIAAERLYVLEAQIVEGDKKATQVAVPFSLDVR